MGEVLQGFIEERLLGAPIGSYAGFQIQGSTRRPPGPRLPFPGELVDQFGMPGGQVIGLDAVVRQVVQLPGTARPLGHQFPVAGADGPVAFVLPVERFAVEGLVCERRHQALPFRAAG